MWQNRRKNDRFTKSRGSGVCRRPFFHRRLRRNAAPARSPEAKEARELHAHVRNRTPPIPEPPPPAPDPVEPKPQSPPKLAAEGKNQASLRACSLRPRQRQLASTQCRRETPRRQSKDATRMFAAPTNASAPAEPTIRTGRIYAEFASPTPQPTGQHATPRQLRRPPLRHLSPTLKRNRKISHGVCGTEASAANTAPSAPTIKNLRWTIL